MLTKGNSCEVALIDNDDNEVNLSCYESKRTLQIDFGEDAAPSVAEQLLC